VLDSDIANFISVEDTDSRKAFNDDFKAEIEELSLILSEAFKLLEISDCYRDQSPRATSVSGYLFIAIESAVTAMQLLSLGHLAPAGNSMRISYESLCLSVLLQKRNKIQVRNGKHKIDFYSEYTKRSGNTTADKAIDLVIKNKDILGLNEGGADFLITAKKFYNGYSHASLMLVHSKIKPSTMEMYVAGGYEHDRFEIFRKQIQFIIRFSRNFDAWIKAVAYNAT